MLTEDIQAVRVIQAPPERVFAAWTEPELFAQWFGTEQVEVPLDSVSLDVRVGGSWRAQILIPGGPEISWAGEYLVVEAPDRLTLTITDDPERPEREPVRLTCVAVPGGTELSLHQPGAALTSEQRERTAAGYLGFFAAIERVLAGEPAT